MRELRLTFFCDEVALPEGERNAYRLLRHLVAHEWIESHDWHVRPPKWTPNEEGDCYTFECYDHLGRVRATALSDWIRRKMSHSELLFCAHERFGHDLLVTTDASLLELSVSTDNANILPPSVALPLAHLYLRARDEFICDAGTQFLGRFNRGLFYLVLLRALLPELWTFMAAAGRQTPTSGALCSAIRIRLIRALQAQDELGRLFFAQRHSSDDRDRMAYHFEYLTLLLLGAIDAQLRVVRCAYNLSISPRNVSFKSKQFLEQLRTAGATAICDLLEGGVHHHFLLALAVIRNKIHADALGDMAYSSPASGEVGLLTLGGGDRGLVLERFQELGNPATMGVFPFDQRILIEPFKCASFLVRKALKVVGAIADATDLGEHRQPLDVESQLARDWFSERNLANMKLISGSLNVL